MLRLAATRRTSALARASALPTLRRSLATITVCDDESQFDLAKKSESAVVYFTATWCGPCRMISTIFEEIAAAKSSSTFLKVDVDEMPEVAAAGRVSAMPTFQFYKQGELVDTIVGADIQKLNDSAEKHLS